MASLIEPVRKLHGPHLVAHENGYDVDVTCEECTRLRLEALDQAAGQGDDLTYSAESVRVPYPCPTRVVAGTTEAEGREEAARMRLERRVVEREEIGEQIARLDAVSAVVRRELGAEPERDDTEDAGEPDEEQPEPVKHDEPGPATRSTSAPGPSCSVKLVRSPSAESPNEGMSRVQVAVGASARESGRTRHVFVGDGDHRPRPTRHRAQPGCPTAGSVESDGERRKPRSQPAQVRLHVEALQRTIRAARGVSWVVRPCEVSDRDPVARCLRRNADDVRQQVAQIG